MTRSIMTISTVLCCALLGACAGTEDCSKPQLYKQAASGKHIEVPDGLNPLPADREVTVPKASPQAPPPTGNCLDSPPTLRTGSTDS